jgi:hypothetical protein
MWRIYNQGTGAVSTPVYYNSPEPIIAGWTTNLGCVIEAEADTSGNVFMALGTTSAPGDANGFAGFDLAVLSVAVAFTAGSAGAYTNAQLNIATPSTPGVDLHYVQPSVPYYISTNPATGTTMPLESQVSNASIPTTFANKLPVASYFTGQKVWGGRSPVFSWYYSGVTALSASGTSAIYRGVARPSGAQFGSREAARANKLAMLYPMFNVNQRADFNPVSGANLPVSFVQPSGKMILSYSSYMVGPDLVLAAAVNPQFGQTWVMCQMPTNSNITDASYNRNGTTIPGFGRRVAEYTVNLPPADTTQNNFGTVFPTGMANPKAPPNVIFPTLASAGPAYSKMNGASVRLGSWTLSGGVYQPPPVVWTYDTNMQTQMTAVFTNALAAAQAAYTGFDVGFFAEVVPILNSAGNGLSGLALGIVTSRNSANNLINSAYFFTPCSLSGTVISLTNPASITLITTSSNTTAGVPGTASGQDQMMGNIHVVYPSTAGGDWYIAWGNSTACAVAGDNLLAAVFVHLTSSNSVTAAGATMRSSSRKYMSCSVQHQGLAIMPYRDGDNMPQVDIVISRYATSATNTQDDLAAGFQAAIANPNNWLSGGTNSQQNNLAEMVVLDAISNTFLLQVGTMSGRINHKQYTLPSSFIDMTSYPVGTYYLYVTYNTTTNTVELQVDSAQRPESSTSMYFGKFDRTSSGFANQSSVSEVVRFGTARLVNGSSGSPMQGSQIRIGPYVG